MVECIIARSQLSAALGRRLTAAPTKAGLPCRALAYVQVQCWRFVRCGGHRGSTAGANRWTRTVQRCADGGFRWSGTDDERCSVAVADTRNVHRLRAEPTEANRAPCVGRPQSHGESVANGASDWVTTRGNVRDLESTC